MKTTIKTKSVVLNWQAGQAEIKDWQGAETLLPLDKTITVTMTGYPNEETKTLVVRDLRPFIMQGYMITEISFEDAEGATNRLEVIDGKYFVGGRELQKGMTIRRYDEVAGVWFEGEVGLGAVYNFDLQKYVHHLNFVVPDYAPSPFRPGDEIEFIDQEEKQMSTEQTTVERALEAAKNRARAEWEDNRTDFESLEAELVATRPRTTGGEYYDIQVNALLLDTIDHDIRGTEEMTMTIHFDQAGEPILSNVKATLWREED